MICQPIELATKVAHKLNLPDAVAQQFITTLFLDVMPHMLAKHHMINIPGFGRILVDKNGHADLHTAPVFEDQLKFALEQKAKRVAS